MSRVLLGSLPAGSRGTILAVGADASQSNLLTRSPEDERSAALAHRMLSMGLIEGASFEIPFDAPYGHDPMAVRVRGALIALRRNEANLITVEVIPEVEKVGAP